MSDVRVCTERWFICRVETLRDPVTDHGHGVDIRVHDVRALHSSVLWDHFVLDISWITAVEIFVFSMLTVLVSITEEARMDANS